MKRLLRIGLVACSCTLVIACDEPRPQPPSGNGGAIGGGGSGGGGPSEHTRELCGRTCAALVACGTDWSAEADCAAQCAAAAQPDPLLEECASCLEAVSCDGVRLACELGPACDGAFDLRVTGANLQHPDGTAVRVLVAEGFEQELWADFAREVPLAGGAFDVTIAGGLPAWGVPFDVVVLVDADGDGACKPGSGDRAWRFPLGLPAADAHVHVDGSTAETPAACAFWTEAPSAIVLEGAGLSAWEGELVVAAPVWVDATFLSIGRFASAKVEDGTFRVELGDFGDYVEEMAPDSEIRLAWMVDLDHDFRCGPGDAGGSGVVPTASGLERRVEAGPTEVGSAPCALLRGLGHDVRLAGGGYDAYEGLPVEALLLDENDIVAAYARGTVTKGEVRLAFAGMAAHGATYDAAIWIDVDESNSCAIPGDVAWTVPVGAVTADVERAVPYGGATPADAAICPKFDHRHR